MQKTTRTVALVVAGVALVVLLYGIVEFFRDDEEDRPPILVKNDSISFEIDDPGVAWVRGTAGGGDRDFWKPAPRNWKQVSEFVLTATGSAAGCDGYRGALINVTQGGYKFQLQVHGGASEPKINDPLSHLAPVTGQAHRLRREGGGEIQLVVLPGNHKCTIPAGGEVTVGFDYRP